MGLWDKIVSSIHWLVDKVLRPIVEWIGKAIQAVIDQIRIWKHKALELLAKWLENDFFFLHLISMTLALAVAWPHLVVALKALPLVLALKAMWEKVKAGLVSVLDFMHILDLRMINQMLQAVWPQWRALTVQLSDAMGALSEELRIGVAGFNAYFSVVRSMAYMRHAFLGTDPKLGELEAFEETSDFLRRANDRFADYTRNPGHIMRDIIEEIYIPGAETLRIAQQDVIGSVKANYDRVELMSGSLRDFELSLEGLRAALPEELERFGRERLDPAIAYLDGQLDWWEREVLPRINGVIAAVDERNQYQDEINERILRELASPYGILGQYYSMSEEEQAAMRSIWGELTYLSMEDVSEEVVPAALQLIDIDLAAAAAPAPLMGIMPSMGYEPAGTVPAAATAAEREKDWFVGEW